jgi:hypothetical protein
MATTFGHRAERFFTSCTSVDIIGGGTMIAVIAEAISVATGSASQPASPAAQTVAGGISSSFGWPVPWWLIVIAVVVLLLLLARAFAEYKRRTYDPTWALKFDDIFNTKEMRTSRVRAIQELQKHKNELRNPDLDLVFVQEVLDFFEVVGFYVHGHQITPEVAHHHFFYWLQAYYQIARVYIETTHEDEPTSWEYIEELYEMTSQIERKRSRGRATRTLTEKQIEHFMKEEATIAAE